MLEEPPQGLPPSEPGSPGRTHFGGRLATVVGLVVAVSALAVYVSFFLLKAPKTRPKVVARLSAVEGSVRVKVGGGGAWTPGTKGRELRTGDIVQTELKAGAAITFVSGNVVTVRPDTVILISEGDAAVAEQATAWHVQSGRVNFDLKRRTEIVTSNTRTTTSADASGSINVTEEGTGVKIFRGSAEVSTARGQSVVLADNQAVLVDKQGAAGPKLALPPPPTLTGPPNQAELPYAHPPQPSAHLVWSSAKGATRYQVAMDYNVVQAELLLSAAFEPATVEGTTHDLSGLDPGKYFWRVAGVSPEGLEGEFSRVFLFAVAPVPPSAPVPLLLEAQAADLESVVEVAGRTDPRAQLTVDGYPAKVLPDGRFCERLRKTGRPSVVIRATLADGQVAEETLRVAAR